jgi:hypothetical protein
LSHLIILVGKPATQELNDTLHGLHPATIIIMSFTLIVTVHFLKITPVCVTVPTVCSRTAGVRYISIVPKAQVSFQHELRLFVCVFCAGLKVLFLEANITRTPCPSDNLLVVSFVEDKRFGCGGHPVAFVAGKVCVSFATI